MGDFDIHRLRIGNWVPSTIKSISYDNLSKKVAIGREEGQIEIYCPLNKWYCQFKVPGIENFKLQSICWNIVRDNNESRLFGISLRGFIFEVDFVNRKIENIVDSYGGTAWCITPSPRESVIAVGCEDGVVRFFQYKPSFSSSSSNRRGLGTLDYAKSLPTSGSRVLSIAFHPREEKIFLGCSDGTIRCHDEVSGKSLFRMVGDFNPRLKINTSIWSLKALTDGTLVSGDSHGQVQFWDGVNGVLMETFKQHQADILSIAVDEHENKVFASGVDGKVVFIQRLTEYQQVMDSAKMEGSDLVVDVAPDSESQWVYVHSHRAHTHDVHSLCTSRFNKEPTLISGGVDSKICTYSINEFVKVRPVWIPATPVNELVSASKDYHRLLINHQKCIELWKVNLLPAPAQNGNTECRQYPIQAQRSDYQKVIRMHLQGHAHIQNAVVSPDGRFMAASSSSGVRFWQLAEQGKDGQLVPMKAQELPEELSSEDLNCTSLAFDPSSQRLVVYSSSQGCLLVYKIDKVPESGGASMEHSQGSKSAFILRHLHSIDHRRNVSQYIEGNTAMTSLEASLSYAVRKIAFDFDTSQSDCLSVQDCFQGAYIYDVQSCKLTWRLPQFEAPVTDLKFIAYHTACKESSQEEEKSRKANKSSSNKKKKSLSPSAMTTPQRLVAALLSNNSIRIFDLDTHQLFPWHCEVSMAASTGSTASRAVPRMPSFITQMNAPLCGIAVHKKHPNKVFLFGQNSVLFVDIAQPIPKDVQLHQDSASKLLKKAVGMKRKVSFLLNPSETSHSETKISNPTSLSAETLDPAHPTFVLFNRYRNLLFFDVLGRDDNPIVLIENPWYKMLEALPDTLERKRYGT